MANRQTSSALVHYRLQITSRMLANAVTHFQRKKFLCIAFLPMEVIQYTICDLFSTNFIRCFLLLFMFCHRQFTRNLFSRWRDMCDTYKWARARTASTSLNGESNSFKPSVNAKSRGRERNPHNPLHSTIPCKVNQFIYVVCYIRFIPTDCVLLGINSNARNPPPHPHTYS